MNGFRAHQSMEKGSLLSASTDVTLELRLEVGTTDVTTEEWEKTDVGDFILFNRCSYDPRSAKGSITLLIGTTPVLKARIKSEGVKISDYALYQEESSVDPSAVILTAEVGRVKMSLDKLLHLRPGALLDLAVQPETGVDLTVEGKSVGKGEVIKLGDAIGVRLLSR